MGVTNSGSALLVIDVQRDVVSNAHRRDEVVATIASLVDRARSEQVPVIWVQHADEELPAHTDGWQIVPELQVGDGELVVHKSHRDSFDGTTLATELERGSIKRLIVTGAQTDFCVRWTLHGAMVRGYDTVLVGDAHTTDDGGPDLPTAAQLISHTNSYWETNGSEGQSAQTADAADVTF